MILDKKSKRKTADHSANCSCELGNDDVPPCCDYDSQAVNAGDERRIFSEGVDDEEGLFAQIEPCPENCCETAEDEQPDVEKEIAHAIAEQQDRYLRLAAEYDNFRKRTAKDLQAAYGNARADTIIRLLPVYDNLERALKMTCTDDAFYKGVEMTMTGLMEVFSGMGIEPIQALHEPFDPNRHSAVMAIENPELGEKVVAEEFQKGFMLGDKVIRFSTVVVAN